ncbi:MAG: GNAT family N-acetyltransferase [Myxococcota bacterium]
MATAIRDLRPAETPALVECVRRCYGETYPEADFYEPDLLAGAIRDGRLASKVAVTDAGRVVGHLATRWAFPGDVVAEAVGGIVDPEHRGQGWLRRLGAEMFAQHRERRLAGLHLFATSAHLRSQKLILAGSGTATGVLLGHIPAGTRYEAIDHDFGDRRIAAVVFYQPLGEMPPLRVFPGDVHGRRLAPLYARAELPRELAEPDPRAGLLPGSADYDARQRIATLRLGNGVIALGTLLRTPAVSRAEVVYAEVPLADPRAAATLEALGRRRFGFGALLPGSERSERLRLQRVRSSRIAPERIRTGSDEVAALVDDALAEQRAVGG